MPCHETLKKKYAYIIERCWNLNLQFWRLEYFFNINNFTIKPRILLKGGNTLWGIFFFTILFKVSATINRNDNFVFILDDRNIFTPNIVGVRGFQLKFDWHDEKMKCQNNSCVEGPIENRYLTLDFEQMSSGEENRKSVSIALGKPFRPYFFFDISAMERRSFVFLTEIFV